MALYTREDFEHHSKIVEDIRAAATRSLLERERAKVTGERDSTTGELVGIDGFTKRKIDRECDHAIEQLKGKLAATRMILADKEKMSKSPFFAFVIERTTKPWLLKRASSNWRETTRAEVERLEFNEGVTIIWVHGRGAKKPSNVMSSTEEKWVAENVVWEPCTREQARNYAGAGEYKMDKEGKPFFEAWYTVRFVETPTRTGTHYWGEFIDIRGGDGNEAGQVALAAIEQPVAPK